MHSESFWSHNKSHMCCVQVQLWGLQGYSWLAAGSDCSAPSGGHRLWLGSGWIGRHAERSGGLQLQRHSQLPPEYRLVWVHVYTLGCSALCLTFYTWTAVYAAFMALSHGKVQTNFLVFVLCLVYGMYESCVCLCPSRLFDKSKPSNKWPHVKKTFLNKWCVFETVGLNHTLIMTTSFIGADAYLVLTSAWTRWTACVWDSEREAMCLHARPFPSLWGIPHPKGTNIP